MMSKLHPHRPTSNSFIGVPPMLLHDSLPALRIFQKYSATRTEKPSMHTSWTLMPAR
jgi:hypothetical protein